MDIEIQFNQNIELQFNKTFEEYNQEKRKSPLINY